MKRLRGDFFMKDVDILLFHCFQDRNEGQVFQNSQRKMFND